MYKTRLNLIEPTKLLERITVDNLRFINPLGHDYASGAFDISPESNDEGHGYYFAKYEDYGTSHKESNIRNEV